MIDTPSIFKLTRKTTDLTRVLTTFAFRVTENSERRKWNIPRLGCGRWTPEDVKRRSVSRWVCKNNSLCLTYSPISKVWSHVTLKCGTLTGTDRFITKGKTGGQQGDPLEMLIFNITIHHLWGRVLSKFQETRESTRRRKSMCGWRRMKWGSCQLVTTNMI
jgi:hypothetical protein